MTQEIHFVTGKGGVGKSVLALSLAYRKSLEGKKVLLVELGDESFYKDFLDLPKVTYTPVSLRKNLDLSLWTGADCLREYALHLIKVETLYRLFFENPISKSLLNVAPALPEIAIMGKITSGPRRHGPQMNYDCLVVDAYATGHFLSLIKAPRGMSQAVKFGPMGEQNRGIDKVLRDEKICHYHIVTLPEELPIREAQELYAEIEEFVGIKADFFINKNLETSLSAANLKKMVKESGGVSEFAHYVEAVLDRQDDAREKIESLKSAVVNLPLVLEVDAWPMIEILAQRVRS